MAEVKLSNTATVTLNFKDEDSDPPKFSQNIYTDTITTAAQTKAVSMICK